MPRSRTRRPLTLVVLEPRDVPSSVAGAVFDDLNGNAVRDAGEPGLAGWTVFVDNNRNGLVDAGEASALSDANGNYAIDTTAVPPFVGAGTGTHYDYVAFVLETGSGGRWLNTTPAVRLVNRDTTPDAAGLDFGAAFHGDAGAGLVGLGGDQLVNAVTSGQQGAYGASVSADVARRYVAGWRTINPGGNDALSVRAFNADGSPLSPEVTVATPVSTYGGPIMVLGPPAVAAAGSADQFAVAWTAPDPATGQFDAYVSTYSKAGVRLSGPTPVAPSSSTVRNFLLGLAADGAGNSVALYARYAQDHFGSWGTATIYAQRFAANGTAAGKAISVVTPNLVNGLKSVAMADNGNFVVVYDDASRGVSSVYAQRYNAAGQKAGSLITVASSTTTVWESRVAMSAAGRVAVEYYDRAAGYKVRRYAADGTPAGPAVGVAPGAAEVEGGGDLALDAADNVTVSWTDGRGGGPYLIGEVHVQRLPAGATIPLADTLANLTTAGVQGGGYSGSPAPGAALAATGTGTFVAVWTGNGPGDDAGVFARRFVPVAPLTAAGGPGAGTTPAPLTDVRLQPIVAEAVRRWERAGLTAAERRLLRSATVHVGDLDGPTLGQTVGTTITIDRDAAGCGWFVDPTPRSNAEFRSPGDQGEQGRMDLLTAVEHELGHALGRDHGAGVMAETLAAGVRESIMPGMDIRPAPRPTGAPGWFLAGAHTRR